MKETSLPTELVRLTTYLIQRAIDDGRLTKTESEQQLDMITISMEMDGIGGRQATRTVQ